MKPEEFKKKLDEILDEASNGGLPLFACVGIMQCVMSDLTVNSLLQFRQQQAAQFAKEFASKMSAEKTDKN